MNRDEGRAVPAGRLSLAALAVECLIWEADFDPKPGLVTRSSPGSHEDMDFALLKRSAESLLPFFADMAAAAADAAKTLPVLRARLGAIGRAAEQHMFAVTAGVNTHKGAIWTMGLLVAAAAMLTESQEPRRVLALAGRLARMGEVADVQKMQLPGSAAQVQTGPAGLSHGAFVHKKFGISGARGEAASDFPHLAQVVDMPMESHTDWLQILLTLYATVEDTNIVHRSSPETLRAFQKLAGECVTGKDPDAQRAAFGRLQELVAAHWLSPGGSADLFAAARFLYRLRGNGAPE